MPSRESVDLNVPDLRSAVQAARNAVLAIRSALTAHSSSMNAILRFLGLATGQRLRFRPLMLVAALLPMAQSAWAADLPADPSNYLERLTRLRPGDRLRLAAGTYRHGLPLHDLYGGPEQPIVIEGPGGESPAIFLGRSGANTVSLRRAGYLVIRNLVLDGANLVVDAVKAEREGEFVHHVTLEGLTIVNHGVHQSIIGISTKCTAAYWTIRNNTIIGAGTGMYLGDSDGSAPFVAGMIEGNRIINTTGYNIQIKQQALRPDIPGLPAAPAETVIRGNLLVKLFGGSTGERARPNLLLGHLPLDGAGSRDRYAVYGNVFFANPTEALLQAEGNVQVENNVFVNTFGDAVRIQPHYDVPRDVAIRGNLVAASGTAVSIRGGDPRFEQLSEGNLALAALPDGEAGADWKPAGDPSANANAISSWLRDPANPDRTSLVLPALHDLSKYLASVCDKQAEARAALPASCAWGALVARLLESPGH